MSENGQQIHPRDWLLLIALSVVWGATFFFNAVALKELPVFTLVFVRVALAAVILYSVCRLYGAALPGSFILWRPFVAMAVLNNVMPFSLLVAGQSAIASGLAAVLNATTPLFTVVIMAAAGEEKLRARRIAGVLLGLAGVAVLRRDHLSDGSKQTLGVLCCLAAAFSYGLSALYARRCLKGAQPLQAATCQTIVSAIMMSAIAVIADQPWRLSIPSVGVVAAVVGVATLSTALAYVLFFQIVQRSGASNVMLVTLLIPVTAIALGTVFLGEMITAREIAGASMIGGALLVIDGRAVMLFRSARAPARR